MVAKSRKRRRSLRPKTAKWSLSFACNHPSNGEASGNVDTICIGIGRGNFTFGTDYGDDWELTVNGPDVAFRWLEKNRFRLSRRKFRCQSSTAWVGNWCWDSCLVDKATVRDVAKLLKGRGWTPEDGSTRLWNWWKKLGEPTETPDAETAVAKDAPLVPHALGELFGPMRCETKDCQRDAWFIWMTQSEYDAAKATPLPTNSVFRENLGTALCDEHRPASG